MAQAIEEIGGVLAIEKSEGRVEARLLRVVPQQTVGDRVKGPCPR